MILFNYALLFHNIAPKNNCMGIPSYLGIGGGTRIGYLVVPGLFLARTPTIRQQEDPRWQPRKCVVAPRHRQLAQMPRTLNYENLYTRSTFASTLPWRCVTRRVGGSVYLYI